jgi:hypothetical protein
LTKLLTWRWCETLRLCWDHAESFYVDFCNCLQCRIFCKLFNVLLNNVRKADELVFHNFYSSFFCRRLVTKRGVPISVNSWGWEEILTLIHTVVTFTIGIIFYAFIQMRVLMWMFMLSPLSDQVSAGMRLTSCSNRLPHSTVERVGCNHWNLKLFSNITMYQRLSEFVREGSELHGMGSNRYIRRCTKINLGNG